MQKPILRVFDNDGVLSDSLKECHLATVGAHRHLDLHTPSLEIYRECDSSEGFRGKKLALGVPEHKLKEYDACWWDLYCKILKENPPQMVPGAKEAIELLASKGEYLALLTQAGEANTGLQLGLAWVKSVFKDTMYVKDKASTLAEYKARMAEYNLIYFGDMLLDGAACLRADVRFAVMVHKYSHTSEARLLEFARAHPDMTTVVNSVTEFGRAAEIAFL